MIVRDIITIYSLLLSAWAMLTPTLLSIKDVTLSIIKVVSRVRLHVRFLMEMNHGIMKKIMFEEDTKKIGSKSRII